MTIEGATRSREPRRIQKNELVLLGRLDACDAAARGLGLGRNDGDLLTHEGPALQAQKEAAAIFGAERTYFVLNGTSASNKIALSALIADGDLVLFDRNNHKAAHHGALLLGGGIPIYLPTDRNAYGLIGPIQLPSLDAERLAAS